MNLFSKKKGVDRKGIPNNYPKNKNWSSNGQILTKFSEGRSGTNNSASSSDSNFIRNVIIADALLGDSVESAKEEKCVSTNTETVVSSVQTVSAPVQTSSYRSSSCSRSRDNDDDDDGYSGGGSDSGGWDDD